MNRIGHRPRRQPRRQRLWLLLRSREANAGDRQQAQDAHRSHIISHLRHRTVPPCSPVTEVVAVGSATKHTARCRTLHRCDHSVRSSRTAGMARAREMGPRAVPMTRRPVPHRHWRSFGDAPLPSGAEALDDAALEAGQCSLQRRHGVDRQHLRLGRRLAPPLCRREHGIGAGCSSKTNRPSAQSGYGQCDDCSADPLC